MRPEFRVRASHTVSLPIGCVGVCRANNAPRYVPPTMGFDSKGYFAHVHDIVRCTVLRYGRVLVRIRKMIGDSLMNKASIVSVDALRSPN